MTANPTWELVRVLPNLSLSSLESGDWTDEEYSDGRRVLALDSQSIAIVPAYDARLASFIARFPIATRLLDGFRNETGAPARASVLIARTDARMPRRTDVIAAFRNAVAMCFILRARAASLAARQHQAAGSWSDLFDFHVIEINTSGHLLAHSPALINLIGKPKQLHLAPSAAISRELDIRFCDATLCRLLAQAWHRLYLQGRGGSVSNSHLSVSGNRISSRRSSSQECGIFSRFRHYRSALGERS